MAAGEKVCPKGHPFPAGGGGKAGGDGEAATVGLDLSRLADAETAPRPPPSRPSTLFECELCERLVETQEHEGRVVFPVFCPWCGKAVEPIVGREIDGYEVGDLLAQGGFGFVYLASNVAEPKMKAVIKFLRPRMGYLQPSLIRVFVEEARLTEEIGQTCWNVGRVSNVRERPWPYFFMEYIRGTTLDQVLRTAKDKKIAIDDAKGYLCGIAKALAATHAHGRVHRDLKPLNIMVIQSQEIRAEERIKLIDFGLSMKIARGRTSFEGATSAFDDGTAAGHSPVQSAGTPEYMPPEAFDGLNEFAGDIYSFGVTAYEILTGEIPWTQPPDGQRFFYWRDTHKKSPPRPIREVRPDVPGWLANVVMKCLEKDPNQRIRTADELISRLREPLPRWVWATASAATILFGVLLWFALKGGGEKRDALWTFDDETNRQNTYALWVQTPEDLAKVQARLTASEGEILSCSASSPDALCKVQDGAIAVGFREGPGLASLIGSSVTIEGRGSGFRVEGILKVGQDQTPPKVVDLGFGELGIIKISQSPPEVLPLPAVKRFHPKEIALAVEIEEDNVREPLLNFHKPLRKPIGGKDLQAMAGRTIWTFSLAALDPGKYTAGVEAADRAGNKDFIENFDFEVDAAPELLLISINEPKYIAARTASYEIEGVEPLQRIEVRGKGVEKWAIHDLQDLQASTPLEVVRKLAASHEVEPRALGAKRYLLAVTVHETSEGPFDLVFTDMATPPNTNETAPLKLPFKAPAPLDAKADIESITVEFEDEDGESLEASFPDFRFPAPARFTGVSRLRASFKKDRVHAMTLALDGAEIEGDMEDRAATVARFDLAGNGGRASTPNKLLLTFRDPLGRTLPLEVSLPTDLRKPKVDFHHQSNEDPNPDNHRIDAWSKVTLSIEADEKLRSAHCTKLGRAIPVNLERDGTRATLSTSGLPFSEGRHSFHIEAWDVAGNRAEVEGVVDLNPEPPRIRPLAKQDSAGVLELTDPFNFEVIDENRPLDYTGAEVIFNVVGEPEQISAGITQPKGGNVNHAVSLMGLPAVAKGTLTIRIADQFGPPVERAWDFSFTRARPIWKPVVPGKDWMGMDWVLVRGRDGKEYYISRTEVTNRVYLARYRKAGARAPRYWGEGDKLPAYAMHGEPVDLAPFPVVGITPEDARMVAKALGGRLPLLVEWLDAAWKDNPAGQYPWKPDEAGWDYTNCYEVWKRQGTPFHDLDPHAKMKWHGGEVVFRAVKAGWDPWPQGVKDRLKYPGEILHLIGNVGEIVVRDDGSHGIVGGSFMSNYEAISLLRDGSLEPFEVNVWTGFRVVIPLDDPSTPDEFKKAARGTVRK